ncbi:unnamed protein product [Durusdinium trenchii]|uniref:Uncharacterized protein n=1 Tax=Durusdinium trenchii TaxID=1381693 RepID=A0ABP0NQY0_9DINO
MFLLEKGRLKSDQEKKVFHRPDKFSENRVCHGFLLLFALRVWQCWKLRPRDQLRCPFLCALPLHAQVCHMVGHRAPQESPQIQAAQTVISSRPVLERRLFLGMLRRRAS